MDPTPLQNLTITTIGPTSLPSVHTLSDGSTFESPTPAYQILVEPADKVHYPSFEITLPGIYDDTQPMRAQLTAGTFMSIRTIAPTG